ncbi:hypothetical protein [Pseudoxanthomonas sp. JBR18]|uniref:hypothetical protein n=1 Tax=Pseudoxanthomonas sp. JBR18 TaxID=2969308 RepID=UPI002305FD80|nr:hypothetical protein [Pseudoxanthomonas sp. JBR18]WCE02815.1 hypothetical protein PJ250_11740 [Pseudoxanthomonas sp. JBR18]
MTRFRTEHGRVVAYLVKRRNGASERQVNDNVFPLETAAYVRAQMDAIASKGEAICRLDDKGMRRYFAPGKTPLQYGRQARPVTPAGPPAPTTPEVPAPRPTVPEAPPAVVPKRPRKRYPRADMRQPVKASPGDILAAQVADFVANGGHIEKLANGVVSKPLKKIGQPDEPVRTILAGRRFRSTA